MRPNPVIPLALLVLAAILILLVNTAGAQTDPPASGDWTVGDVTVVTDQVVRLRGDLKVVSGGHLTLSNVTLQVFSDATNLHGILVTANGTLRITDGDGNATTSGDSSVVMRGNPSYGYSFLAEKGSELYIGNSLLTNMGASGGTGGVLIRTDKARLQGSTFLGGHSYNVRLEDNKDIYVYGCNFNESNDGLVLKGCNNISMDNCQLKYNDRTGLVLEGSTNITVTGADIFYNGLEGARIVGGSHNTLEHTQISHNLRGLVLEGESWFVLWDCEVVDTDFNGISISKGSHNISIDRCVVRSSKRSGLEADGVHDLTIYGSVFRDSGYYGLRIFNGSRSVILSTTSAYDNGYDGVHMERSRDVLMIACYFAFNGYNGAFVIDTVNVTVNAGRYMNNTYDGLNFDHVRDLLVDGIDVYGNGYHGLNVQAGSTDVTIIGGWFRYNTRCGVALDSVFNVTGTGNPLMRYNGDYGLRVEGGASNISMRCFILNNTRGALRVIEATDLLINASVLIQTDLPGFLLHVREGQDILITNSTTVGTAHLEDGSNVSLVHCTFDDVVPDVDGNSRLGYGEFVTVEVVWPNKEPVAGAAVNATGRGGGVLARGMTTANGTTEEMTVIFKAFVGESVTDQNPISFWARKGIEVARNTTTITERSRVFILLSDDFPPVAVAPPVSAELGEKATMDGSGSTDNGEVVSWVWTFDDGVGTVVLEGRRVNWTFTVLGDFVGELNVSDSVGHWNTTTFLVQVTDTTAPVAEAGENVTVDQGEWVQVDGTASTDNDMTLIVTGKYWWVVFSEDPEVPPRIYTGLIASIQFPNMGLYRIVLNVTDQSGNLGQDRMWVTVLDTTPPEVDSGPDIEVDEGEEVLIEPLSVTDNDPAFDADLTAWWRVTGPDTDMTMDGLVLVFITPRMGVFQATFHVSDAAGNEGSNSLLVTARDVIPPTVDIGVDMTVEMLTELAFDTNATTDNDPAFPDGATYRWRISGPGMDEEHRGDSISFSVPWVGEYVIQLTVADEAGNEGVAIVTVTSVDTALPEFGDISPTHLETVETGNVPVTFIITDVGTGIDPQTVEMRTRTPSGEPWTDWQRVSITSGGNRVEETMVLQFPQGTSTLQLRISDLAGNGPVESEAFIIRVNSRPSVVVLSPTEGADFGHLDEIKLDASPSSDVDGDVLSFRWSSDVVGLLGTEAVVTAPPLSPGIHRISVIVSDGVEGHDSLVTVTITVLPEPSTVDPEEGAPWWFMLVAVLLFMGFALVVWDHQRKRRRTPPADGTDDRV